MVTEDNPDLVNRINELLYANGIHVIINGCGCCNSPWLYDEKSDKYIESILINSTKNSQEPK